MSLWIDIQAAQTPESAERGIGRYTVDLTRALIRSGEPIAGLGLNPLLPRPDDLPADLFNDPRLAWTTARSVRQLTNGDPFVHLTMSPMEGGRPSETVIPPWLADPGVSSAAVVYDLIPYLFAQHYTVTPAEQAFFKAREMSLRQFDILLAISEYTRSDLIHHWGIRPDRVVNIGSGASGFFRRPGDGDDPFLSAAAALPIRNAGFVLSIVGYDWRKNAESLIDAWAQVPRAVRHGRQLVLTCRVPDGVAARWIGRGVAAGLSSDEIVVTGFVDDQILRSLYQAAGLLVFPSRYEGFGLPVLEAARCGTPSITSNRSSLPEILDMPESLFDPDDTVDMARVIVRALSDDAFFRDLESASEKAAEVNTWDRVAKRVIAATSGLAERTHRRSRPVRVAVLGTPGPRAHVTTALNNNFAVEEFGAGATAVELVGGVRQLSSFDISIAAVDGTEPLEILLFYIYARPDIVCFSGESRLKQSSCSSTAAPLWDHLRWKHLGALVASTQVAVVQDPIITGRLRIETGPIAKPEIVLVDGEYMPVVLRRSVARLVQDPHGD